MYYTRFSPLRLKESSKYQFRRGSELKSHMYSTHIYWRDILYFLDGASMQQSLQSPTQRCDIKPKNPCHNSLVYEHFFGLPIFSSSVCRYGALCTHRYITSNIIDILSRCKVVTRRESRPCCKDQFFFNQIFLCDSWACILDFFVFKFENRARLTYFG